MEKKLFKNLEQMDLFLVLIIIVQLTIVGVIYYELLDVSNQILSMRTEILDLKNALIDQENINIELSSQKIRLEEELQMESTRIKTACVLLLIPGTILFIRVILVLIK